MKELTALALLAAMGAWWWTAMRVREHAIVAARRACRSMGVQFLDDSVVLDRIRLRRDGRGTLRLWRQYRFEFTQSGGERCHGYMTLLGRRVVDVDWGGAAGAPTDNERP